MCCRSAVHNVNFFAARVRSKQKGIDALFNVYLFMSPFADSSLSSPFDAVNTLENHIQRWFRHAAIATVLMDVTR